MHPLWRETHSNRIMRRVVSWMKTRGAAPRRGRIAPQPSHPSIKVFESEKAGLFVFAAAGEWLVATAGELDQQLRANRLPSDKRVILDLAGIDRLDTAGAWLLVRTEHELAARGNTVEISNLRANFLPLFEHVRNGGIVTPARHPRPANHTITGFLAQIGEITLGLLARSYRILGFFGLVCVTASGVVRHPRRLRLTAMSAQMEQTGVNAVAIVGLLSFLIGIVIAYREQTSYGILEPRSSRSISWAWGSFGSLGC